MEGLIRDIREEEVTMLLKTVMENNIKILGLQKTLMIIIKRNKQEKELKRREYKKDWKKKNREEERKKLDNE